MASRDARRAAYGWSVEEQRGVLVARTADGKVAAAGTLTAVGTPAAYGTRVSWASSTPRAYARAAPPPPPATNDDIRPDRLRPTLQDAPAPLQFRYSYERVCHQRYKIEHAFAKLGHWRRLSRCYEGPEASAAAWLQVASVAYLLWRAIV